MQNCVPSMHEQFALIGMNIDEHGLFWQPYELSNPERMTCGQGKKTGYNA